MLWQEGGSLIVPKGFLASGIRCGIKPLPHKDLGIILFEDLCNICGFFTKNKIKAAPVKISMSVEKKGVAKAIIVNSGVANAFCGKKGMDDAKEVIFRLSQKIGCKEDEIIFASTGTIGEYLPKKKIIDALSKLIRSCGSEKDNFISFAKAIMTTDTVEKISYLERDGVRILGIAKGAGMIMPNMATMLSFILTDIESDRNTLKKISKTALEKTFNAITVDGDTSTNDMVIICASGKSRIGIEKFGKRNFYDLIYTVMDELSKMIVKDGEGATKFVEIEVFGALTNLQAKKAATSVANSPLVKCAIFGEDPNWGRIVAALGKAGIEMSEEKLSLEICGEKVVESGKKTDFSEDEVKKKLSAKNVSIKIDLGIKKGYARIYTCDLSPKYIEINSTYRS